MVYYHIIDHLGRGTIHNLVFPLCSTYSNHIVVCPKSKSEYFDRKMLRKINAEENTVIIHSTGQFQNNYLSQCLRLFPHGKIFVFLHTSVAYQRLKGREDFLTFLKVLQNSRNIPVLVPSIEVAQQYWQEGIFAKAVQLGIPSMSQLMPNITAYNESLENYYGRIITTCGSEKEVYKYVKGIDKFFDLVTTLGYSQNTLVAGCTFLGDIPLECQKFSETDFLNILYHSKIYIQLSRYETYNITAIQAKQLKKPVAVLACEGTPSCMGKNVCINVTQVSEKLILAQNSTYDQSEIEDNYSDSILRESLLAFKNSIEEVCINAYLS